MHGLKIAATQRHAQWHTDRDDALWQTGFARAAGGRRFLELGDFFVISDIGLSIYHGGSLQIQKRFGHGFSLHSSYTFSKTISNSDSVANLADFPEGPNINLERAPSRQSTPHRYTLVFVSESE